MIAAIVVIFSFSRNIGLFLIVLTVVQACIPKIFNQKMERAGASYSAAREVYMDRLQEGLSAYMTARIFHMEDQLVKRFTGALKESEKRWKNREFTEAYVSSFSYVFNQIAYMSVFLLGGYMIASGSLRVSQVVAITNLTQHISGPALYLVDDIAKLKIAKEPFRKIRDIVSMEDDVGGKKVLSNQPHRLEVRDLTCRFGERVILNHVNYAFEPGKKYLITGSSGVGKSTILAILSGNHTDYSGDVRIDGISLSELSREQLTSVMCFIDQEPVMFHDSVYQNIALYDEINEDIVSDAILRVGLRDRIAEMENDMHSVLEEKASNLSAGEKQRISIARALVRRTPIWLMDESTSHLDAATADEIEHLLCGFQHITLLLVTHHVTEALAHRADVMLEINDGELIEISRI